MPRATYTLAFELDINSYTDLTTDLYAPTPLIIERGMQPGAFIADVGQMTFDLYSPDGRYVPGHPNQMEGFDLGIGVRLHADAGSGQQTLFYGRLYDIVPVSAPGGHGQVVTITVLDDMARYAETRLGSYPMQYDVRADQILFEMLKRAPLPPGQQGFWRLGYPEANSQLGQTTTLGDRVTGTDIDAGQSVFPWAGDGWPFDISLRDVMQQTAVNEAGHFYLKPDGTPTFDERQTRPKKTAADAVLDQKLVSITADSRRQNLVNQVEITVYPREVSSEYEVLWQLNNPVRLRRNDSRTFTFNYRDPNQEVALLGAIDVLEPVPNVDIVVTGTQYGWAGTYNDLWLVLSYDSLPQTDVITEIGAASARITVTNRNQSPRGVTLETLQLRGKPLRIYEPLTVTIADDASQLQQDQQVQVIDLPLEDDTDMVLDLGYGILNNNKNTRPWLTVTFEATADTQLLNHALTRDINARLSLTASDLGLDETGAFIDHVRHEISQSGAKHQVTWQTSPADLNAYWIIGETGYGELDQAARLGY